MLVCPSSERVLQALLMVMLMVIQLTEGVAFTKDGLAAMTSMWFAVTSNLQARRCADLEVRDQRRWLLVRTAPPEQRGRTKGCLPLGRRTKRPWVALRHRKSPVLDIRKRICPEWGRLRAVELWVRRQMRGRYNSCGDPCVTWMTSHWSHVCLV